MSDTSLLFNFLKGRDTATPHMKRVADSSQSMASRIRVSSIVSVAATATVVAGFASLGAQGVALVSALSPLAGLLATVPALTVAAAGGIATLIMGFSGLGAAMKQSSGGGASAAAAISAAEKRIAQAQRESTAAQLAVNDARLTAAERLDDMARSLRRASLDEESATLAVTEAQIALRKARQGGDRNERARAELAYRESLLTLEEVRDRLGDLSEEEAKASAAGVEGSDEVRQALQRQADAVEALAEANDALTKARQGGGGVDKAAEAYAKLSLAGKQLVDVLKAIAPQWRTVQQAVQQSVLAGVAGDLSRISGTYLPVMRAQLPAIGQGWNTAFRDTAALATTAGFVADINTTLGNTATFWRRIGASFAPFLSGFRQFAVVGSTFLPGIGSWVERGANAFNRWASAARESGRAQQWMSNALVVLSQVWEILKNLGRSIAAIFRAGSAGPAFLPGLVAGTAALAAFLASPAGQGKLAAVFATLREVGTALWEVLKVVAKSLFDLVPAAGGATLDTISVFGVAVGFLADHVDLLAKALPFLAAGFLIVKSAQVISTIAAVADVPVRITQSIVMWRHTAALRANTAAMAVQTGAQKTSLVAMGAAKVAILAGAVATGVATVAQWAWNAAVYAFPVVLIIAIIAAIVAGIIWLWNTNEGFRNFFIGMWDHIWSFLKMIGAWFAGPFANFFVSAWHFITGGFQFAIDFITGGFMFWINMIFGFGERIGTAARGMWDGIVASFRAAVNWMIRLWNNFSLTIGGGQILGVSIPSVTLNTPDIPYLARGGRLTSGGSVVVGDGGEPEIVDLPRGATVTPLSRAGGGVMKLVIEISGPDEMKKLIRKITHDAGGGNVQVAFGS